MSDHFHVIERVEGESMVVQSQSKQVGGRQESYCSWGGFPFESVLTLFLVEVPEFYPLTTT